MFNLKHPILHECVHTMKADVITPYRTQGMLKKHPRHYDTGRYVFSYVTLEEKGAGPSVSCSVVLTKQVTAFQFHRKLQTALAK